MVEPTASGAVEPAQEEATLTYNNWYQWHEKNKHNGSLIANEHKNSTVIEYDGNDSLSNINNTTFPGSCGFGVQDLPDMRRSSCEPRGCCCIRVKGLGCGDVVCRCASLLKECRNASPPLSISSYS